MKALVAEKLADANGIRENAVVLIDGDKIVGVGDIATTSIPSSSEVYDLGDMTLLPGLIDCHIHFTGSDRAGVGGNFSEPAEVRITRAAVVQTRQLLDSGFTSVMDAGGLVGLYVRNIVNAGIVDGPRVKSAGRYLSQTAGHGDSPNMPIDWVKAGLPYGWGMDGRIADGVDECLRGVRENLRLNVDFVKLCTGGGGGGVVDPWWVAEYSVEEIKAMCDAAHSYGKKVMAHCYSPESIKRSVAGGVDIVTHGNQANDEAVELMKKAATLVVPTMTVYERMARNRPGGPTSYLYQTLFSNIRKLYDAGLTLAIGTDSMGGSLPMGGSALELELYADKVGLSPLEALKIGTLNGAKIMGMEDKLGTLEPNKLADVIAVKGDPLHDIKLLQDHNRIQLVIKEGKIVKNLL
ncbi:amidohydrolase family protein [Candidatus Bathyarchaeota archaeon]|nr:amidohydrolase family protein [Candidatus Bathyarchaeota archaeon]